jgi:serine/threonine-protein kinase
VSEVSIRRWQEIRPLFDELVALEEDERTARLAQLVQRDPELWAALDSMLRHDAATDERLKRFNGGVADLLQHAAWDVRPDDLAAKGSTVAQFEILERVAAGGMGIVYRALDTRLRRVVALKIPLQQHDPASAIRKRFLREARSASALDHPNLCPVYEAGETDDGLLFIAMPFYEGRTMSEILAASVPLPVERALEIARQTAAGLACAHASGIVHRDLKPGNLMVLPDGTVKILDFGLATVADLSRTMSRSTAGTPAYMSPEQVRGAAVDHRADLWALGVLLYEMTTAARPFRGDNEWSTAHNVLHADPAPPSALRAEIPLAVENLILSLLQKDPRARYASAEAVRQDIMAIQAGQVPSSLTGRIRGTRLRPYRNRRNIALVVSALVVAVVGLGALLFRNGAPEVPAVSAAGQQKGTAAADEIYSPRAIAVLPFRNLSGAERDDYFSDGLTQELTGALSQIKAVRVAARSSAAKFGSEHRDIREVGRALHVGTVVEGSVRKNADRVRVAVQVTNARDGFQVWSHAYELRGAEVLNIGNELAGRIANAVEAELTPGERARLALPPTRNLEAYDSYLKGAYFGHQRSRDGLARAIEHFEKAIVLDPHFAAAHAGLANVFPPYATHGFLNPQDARERMRMPALNAVAFDPGLAEAQVALAAYLSFFEWDWSAGEQAFRRAIAIDPGNGRARGWYSFLLSSLGRHDEALRGAKIQAELGPLGPFDVNAPGQVRVLAGDTSDEALALVRKGVDLDSTVWLVQVHLGWAHEIRKEWDEAIRAYERATRLARSTSIPRADLARVLALTGRRSEARKTLEELRGEAARTGIYLPQVATILAALGEPAAAIEWLEFSANQRHPGLPHALVEPGFEPIRNHPRLVALLRRHRLPE